MTERTPRLAIRRAGLVGVLSIVALLGALVVWSMRTEINGAVVAQGAVTVQGRPKAVQHLDGGIVAEILVADGDAVSAGEPMLRLDSTLLEANLEIYRNRLAEALARRDRLIAESTGLGQIDASPLPPLLAGRDMTAVRTNEATIFTARRDIAAGRTAQMGERIAQFHSQIDGVTALIEAKREQVRYIDQELERLTTLQSQGLARETDILTLQGTRTDLLGQVAEHVTEIARIEGSIADSELEVLQADRQAREEALTGLADVTTSIEELTQQIRSTETQLARVLVRAPVTGYVHELQVSAVGGVVAPGATVAQVVATEGGHSVDFRVAPTAIDQIRLGQSVRLRFPAFHNLDTPELTGTVIGLSPTTVADEVTGQSFYRVEVDLPADELARLDGLDVVAGMPVDGFIGTNPRSVASYLVAPFAEQMRLAFREE